MTVVSTERTPAAPGRLSPAEIAVPFDQAQDRPVIGLPAAAGAFSAIFPGLLDGQPLAARELLGPVVVGQWPTEVPEGTEDVAEVCEFFCYNVEHLS